MNRRQTPKIAPPRGTEPMLPLPPRAKWLSFDEAGALAWLVAGCDGPVAEVGSWTGWAARTIANARHSGATLHLYELAPTPEDFKERGGMVEFKPTSADEDHYGAVPVDVYRRDILPVLQRGVIPVLRDYLHGDGIDNVRIFRGDFKKRYIPGHYQAVFADCTHTQHEAAVNITSLVAMLKVGGVLACHDVTGGEVGKRPLDVISLWLGEPERVVDSLGIWRKKRWTLDLSCFDDVFCINLDRREDRWNDCLEEFETTGIAHRVRRFPAISYGPGLINAERACRDSHMAVLDMTLGRGAKSVLVLEDDVHFIHGRQFAPPPADWALHYLGGLPHGDLDPAVNGSARIRNNFMCTHAVAYSRAAYPHIQKLRQLQHPLDHILSGEMCAFHPCYVAAPMVALQRNSTTDIPHTHGGKDALGTYSLNQEIVLREKAKVSA